MDDNRMTPVAFDIETTGFDGSSAITVAGLAYPELYWVVINTDNQYVEEEQLQREVREGSGRDAVFVTVADTEYELLDKCCDCMLTRFDKDQHYITIRL